MKVFFISTLEVAPWGGSEDLWYLLADRVLGEGHSIGINRLEWNPVPAKLQQLAEKGAEVFYRPNVHIPRSRTDVSFRIKNKLFNSNPWKPIDAFNPDMIVISQAGTFDYFTEKLASFLLESTIPFILICQHTFEFGYLADQRRQLFRQIFAKAGKVFFVAHRNKSVAERVLACPLPNSAVIYNPIKIPEQVALSFPALQVARMACVARLDIEYKGQDILLQTLASEKWRSRPWTLSFYGKGPNEKYLQELVAFYQLEDKVSFKGHVDQVTDIWQDHHLLVLPSHSEGTPLSLLEASYCCRPAVVTDVGGNTEVVIDGKSGFVAAVASVNALDQALDKAWENQHLWEEMGLQARKHVAQVVGYNNFDSILNTILRT